MIHAFHAISLIGLMFVSLNSSASSDIGGNWNQEAVDAWREFKKDKEASEEALADFLKHGSLKQRTIYYEKACEKGSPNFCTLLGLSFVNKDNIKAANFYKKACDIDTNPSVCMLAVLNFLKSNKLKEAQDVFIKACNSDSVFCDNADKVNSGYKQFRKMILVTCKNGHEYSCTLLDKYGLKH